MLVELWSVLRGRAHLFHVPRFYLPNFLMWFDSLPLLGPGGLAVFLFRVVRMAPSGPVPCAMPQLPIVLPNRKIEKKKLPEAHM